jgi:hypothetical protein
LYQDTTPKSVRNLQRRERGGRERKEKQGKKIEIGETRKCEMRYENEIKHIIKLSICILYQDTTSKSVRNLQALASHCHHHHDDAQHHLLHGLFFFLSAPFLVQEVFFYFFDLRKKLTSLYK